MRYPKIKLSFIALFLSVAQASLLAQVYVKTDAAGTNNGSSWENAYNDLDFAIKNAHDSEIWVAKGTYKPFTDRDGNINEDSKALTFILKPGVAIYGGFAGTETRREERDWKVNETILSGNVGEENIESDNSNHVVSGAGELLNQSTVLDGFTMTGGYNDINSSGAGIYVNQRNDAFFTIRNCTIKGNKGRRGGGGLYLSRVNAVIENNLFMDNEAGSGGAIYLSTSHAIIRNNEIRQNEVNNSSNAQGGGIYVGSSSSPEITNNVFIDNKSEVSGGAVCFETSFEAVFSGNFVLNNEAKDGGGIFNGSSNVVITNNVIAGNKSTNNGGGIFMDYSRTSHVINNTIVNNEATENGGGLYSVSTSTSIINCIVVGNKARNGPQLSLQTVTGTNRPRVLYSNIEGGITEIETSGGGFDYTNNTDLVPEFVDPDNGYYDLRLGSGLINAGTIDQDILGYPWPMSGRITEIGFMEIDIIGNDRIIEGAVEMGAYEVSPDRNLPPLDIALSVEEVSGNADMGDLVGVLSTTDLDSDTFSYSILRDDQDCFAISGDELQVGCDLSGFISNTLLVEIQSTDEGGLNHAKAFEIKVSLVTGITELRVRPIIAYPNPTAGVLHLGQTFHGASEINLISLAGRQLSYIKKNSSFDKIDLSDQQDGFYVLTIENNGELFRQKVLIERQ